MFRKTFDMVSTLLCFQQTERAVWSGAAKTLKGNTAALLRPTFGGRKVQLGDKFFTMTDRQVLESSWMQIGQKKDKIEKKMRVGRRR